MSGGVNISSILGSGVKYQNGKIVASGIGVLPTSNTYTASGAIALSDQKSVINTTSGSLAMTISSGSDGQQIVIKRFGQNQATLSGVFDGVQTTITMNKASVPYESLNLVWDAANSTWEVT